MKSACNENKVLRRNLPVLLLPPPPPPSMTLRQTVVGLPHLTQAGIVHLAKAPTATARRSTLPPPPLCANLLVLAHFKQFKQVRRLQIWPLRQIGGFTQQRYYLLLEVFKCTCIDLFWIIVTQGHLAHLAELHFYFPDKSTGDLMGDLDLVMVVTLHWPRWVALRRCLWYWNQSLMAGRLFLVLPPLSQEWSLMASHSWWGNICILAS